MKRKRREFAPRTAVKSTQSPRRAAREDVGPAQSTPGHSARLPPAKQSLVRLQSLVGNAGLQRLLVQRTPESDGHTIETFLASLRQVTAPPPAEHFLEVIHSESQETGLKTYLKPDARETIRNRYHDADARRILGALLRAPYSPGIEAIFYDALKASDKTAFDEVNDQVNKDFADETGITGALDWGDPQDRPFARRWLMLRDKVMEQRAKAEIEEEKRRFQAELLAKASSPADLHAALKALEVDVKIDLLTDAAFKKELKTALGDWDEFVGCLEDLGASAPSAADLEADPTVHAALADAWRGSLPESPFGLATDRDQVETHNHEEGGWIYVNLVTNAIEVRRQSAKDHTDFEWDDYGNLVPAISLELPPEPKDCVLVANFHVHPNQPRYAGASGWDGRSISGKLVPGLLRDTEGIRSYGETTQRASLKGNQGYP
jgi:hypothetical protein